MAVDIPRQGDIFSTYLPNDDPTAEHDHRVIVISRDEFNGGNKVLIVPLTSRHFASNSKKDHCVPFHAHEFEGITKDCVARCDNIYTVAPNELDWEKGRLGTVNESSRQSIADAIYNVVSPDPLSQ